MTRIIASILRRRTGVRQPLLFWATAVADVRNDPWAWTHTEPHEGPAEGHGGRPCCWTLLPSHWPSVEGGTVVLRAPVVVRVFSAPLRVTLSTRPSFVPRVCETHWLLWE